MDNEIINKNIVNVLKSESEHADRKMTKGIINDKTGSSMLLKGNGDVVAAASSTVQYKLKYDTGTATEISFQSNTITNKKNIKTDEIVINNHKLNPQFYELTDMKTLFNDPTQAIGNLTVNCMVLVKAWEPFLKKWVLIRRPMRTPVFSNLLNIPSVPENMNIDDSISKEIESMRKTSNKENILSCI